MWRDWLVLQWTFAALGSLVFWLIVGTILADYLHRNRTRRTRRHDHDHHRPTPV